ncbi:MAG: hypothetical protein LBH09_00355, partial [Peptococcaceae bacterium]|nr:hypothetical protein [Peptococcaceae bacterium]
MPDQDLYEDSPQGDPIVDDGTDVEKSDKEDINSEPFDEDFDPDPEEDDEYLEEDDEYPEERKRNPLFGVFFVFLLLALGIAGGVFGGRLLQSSQGTGTGTGIGIGWEDNLAPVGPP